MDLPAMGRDDQPVFRLRIAASRDAACLTELGARLFEQTFGPANDPANMRDYLAQAFSESLQRVELADPRRTTWIAEDSTGTPIGYAVVRRETRGDGVVFERPLEVQRIYADKIWHGRGVGDTLMDACIEQATRLSCDGVWLAVWKENPRAIAFYERRGFKTVGVATFTLGRDVQHDLVMARPAD